MSYCVECGLKLGENDKFCKECGTPVSAVQQRREEKNLRHRHEQDSEVRDSLHRGARISAYSFAIAWDFALLIFFNFFSDFLAYYHIEPGTEILTKYPLVTSDFSLWQPIVTTALLVSIIGYVIMIIIDSYPVRQFVRIAIDILSIWTISSLIGIFPFDFSPIPITAVADMFQWLLPLMLGFVIFGICIGIFVRVIKLIMYAVNPKRDT